MGFLIVIICVALYIICGVLAVFVSGLIERFFGFECEGESILLALGIFGLLATAIVFFGCLIGRLIGRLYNITSLDSVVEKIKKLGSGK